MATGSRRLRLPALERGELLLASGALAATALLALLGIGKLGTAGVLLPLAVVAVCILLTRPLLTVAILVSLTILCEGPSFGILSFTSDLYSQAYKYVSLLDVIVALAVFSVALDVMRHRRAFVVPKALRLPLAMLALAMAAGVATGHANGAGLRYAIASEHVLFYLLLLPVAVANLDIDRSRISQLLAGAMALAVLKGILGLVEVVGHYGAPVEGSSTLTYYEPASNWLIMGAVLVVVAAAFARVKPPLWLALSFPVLVACLLLSYRRSFWIASVLGVLLLALLATSAAGRRLLIPGALAVAGAILLVGSINFQAQIPIVKRAESLAPSRLEANLEDRYRLDERANVLGEIREHPLTGLGVTIPWAATVRPLPVEHEEGREYVHFAALWFWLKLGLLGLLAYACVMLGGMALAFQAWRRSEEPWLRAFAVASLVGMAGLIAMDTTASFTGVDARFTVLFAAQLGLLGLLSRPSRATLSR